MWNRGSVISLLEFTLCPVRQRRLTQKRKLTCVLTNLAKLAIVGMLRRDLHAGRLDDLDKAEGMYVVQIQETFFLKAFAQFS